MKPLRFFLLILLLASQMFSEELKIFEFDGVLTKYHKGFIYEIGPNEASNGDWTQTPNYAEGAINMYCLIRDMPSNDVYIWFNWYQDTVGFDKKYEAWTKVEDGHVTKGQEFKKEIPMANIRHYDGGIDFSKPRNRQCLRFSTAGNASTSNQIRADYGHDQHMAKYFPMNIKFIAVMVSKGGTFSGWGNYVSNNGADKEPPQVRYAEVTGEKEISITFTEYVGDGALSAGSYTLDNGATVSSAKYGFDHTQVLLTTSSLDASKTYKLQLSNIKDEAASPNTIAAASINLDAKPVSAYTIHQAELYDHCNKVIRIPGHVYSVVNNYGKESDEYFRIANLDFGDGASECRVRGLSDKGASPAKVEIRLDSPTGTKIAEVGFPKEKDHTFKYVTLSKDITENVTGVHDVYVMMKSQMGLGGVDWIQFISKDGVTETAPRRKTIAQLSSPLQSQHAAMYSLQGRQTSGYNYNQLILVRDARGKISKRIAGMK